MSYPDRLTILFLAANPADMNQLQLDEEMRSVDNALRMTDHWNRFDFRSHWAVRPSDLHELLLRYKPYIVHFSGHGSDTGEILLKSDGRDAKSLAPEALASLFGILKDNVHCVVLNACFSERQAYAIAQHIDCVVGMSRAILDSSAIEFATAFYRGIGYGRSIQTAFDLGCNQIGLAGQGIVLRKMIPVSAMTEPEDVATKTGEAAIPQLISLRLDPAEIMLIDSNLSAGAPVSNRPLDSITKIKPNSADSSPRQSANQRRPIWQWFSMITVVILMGMLIDMSIPSLRQYLTQLATSSIDATNGEDAEELNNEGVTIQAPTPTATLESTATPPPTVTATAQPTPTPDLELARNALTSGQQALGAGNFSRAIEQCGLAIELDPSVAEAYFCRGFAYDQLNDNEAAIRDYSEVIRLDPTFNRAYLGRGLLYANVLNDCEKAIPDLETYLETPGQIYEAQVRAALQRCQT